MVENAPAWFALHVKPRHEFLVHQDLAKNGMEAFLPALSKLSQWKDRKKRIDLPLFPGYLFARVLPVPEHFLGLVKTRGVMRVLASVPGQPTPVPDAEIEALKALLTGSRELYINPELREGKLIRIRRGVFANVEGVVSRIGGQFLLHVNIAMLGRCVTVKMFADDVELL